jgi:hypothetical protein
MDSPQNSDTPITTPSDQLSNTPPSAIASLQPVQQAPDPSQQSTPAQPQTQSPQQPTPGQQSPNPQQPQAQQPQQPAHVSQTQRFLDRARTITDQMVGGDPYTTSIDPNTGVTTRTRQPLSPRAISMALVLEALQGAAAGAGKTGPGALGQAAQAGLAQGEKIAAQRTAAQTAQDTQAQTDVKNQQESVRNMLQTRQLLQTSAKQDEENSLMPVTQSAQAWADAQKDPSSILGQGLDYNAAYKLLSQPGVMGHASIVTTGAQNATGPDGKPVWVNHNGDVVAAGTDGAHTLKQYTLAVVKDNAPTNLTDASGKLLPQYQTAYDQGYTNVNGANGTLPSNYQTDTRTAQSFSLSSAHALAALADVNQGRARLNMPPLSTADFNKMLKDDPTLRNGIQDYWGVLNTQHGNHQAAFDKVSAGPNGGAATTIAGLFGGTDNVARLDALAANDKFNSGVIDGTVKLDTPQAIADAQQSLIPKVRAAGDQAQAQVDARLAHTKLVEAQAEEQGKLPGEIKLAQIRANAGGAATPDAIEQTGEGVANGTLTLDTITDRPTRSKVEAWLTQHHPNLDQNSVTLTPDERKKKQLAQADLLNLGVIKDVLTRKPQLVGALAGRVTNGEWAVGTNDPDLERLKLAYDNYALPAVGIHGSRSVVNKQEAIDVLSNHNKNGAQAVLAGVRDAQNSANVFANQGQPRGKNGSVYVVIPRPQQPGQVIDLPTAQKYVTKYGKAAAQAAAQNDGWALPPASSAPAGSK